MTSGYVVSDREVEPQPESGTGQARLTIDASCGCERLEQRVLTFAPGRSEERHTGDRQEVLYVASGRGTLLLGDDAHELAPETGAFLVPGDRYAIENSGPDELVLVSVSAPCEASERTHVTVRYADRPVLPASPNREFRYLVNQDAGCLDVTQFVGTIPPGRAAMHSHTYDEVVYVVDGEGVLHLGGRDTPLRPGTCIHLPPLEEHSLENTGPTPMRVLGVFHPSGDPASRAYVAND
ncbi:MAG TPA: cupin domain-containing protein [Gaiellaceae bacterium]|nr:cupin domain-containing protein [Gaiellaceae bacterium]